MIRPTKCTKKIIIIIIRKKKASIIDYLTCSGRISNRAVISGLFRYAYTHAYRLVFFNVPIIQNSIGYSAADESNRKWRRSGSRGDNIIIV